MTNILLYIDGDNFSDRHFCKIVEELKLSNPNANIISKVFGNFTKVSIEKWESFYSIYGLKIVHIPKIKNKNVTDHFIIVSCMEDLYSIDFDTFAMASDDLDFFVLYQALKCKNKKIIKVSQNTEEASINPIYIDNTINISIKNDRVIYTRDEVIEMINLAMKSFCKKEKIAIGDIKVWLQHNIDNFDPEKLKFSKFSRTIEDLNHFILLSHANELHIKNPHYSLL